MKKTLLAFGFASFIFSNIDAQITIAANDMPVLGDTLRWSAADPLTANINTSLTGANTTWDFSTMVAVSQGVDAYKSAAAVNPIYAFTIAPTAYGYNIGNNLPGIPGALPITIKDIHTFFSKKTNPSRFVAEGFGAQVNGAPLAAAYSDEDEIYFFPLTFGAAATNSTFKVKQNIPTLGGFTQEGSRNTIVDGWGTITTPFTTSPVQVIRVRSEINEIDSVDFGGTKLGIPRISVEYKWLSNTSHYPMMQANASKNNNMETVTQVRYRDTKRPLSVIEIRNNIGRLALYPNPTSATISLEVPAQVQAYIVEVFDATGRVVLTQNNSNELKTTDLSAGTYLVRMQSGTQIWMNKFVKQ